MSFMLLLGFIGKFKWVTLVTIDGDQYDIHSTHQNFLEPSQDVLWIKMLPHGHLSLRRAIFNSTQFNSIQLNGYTTVVTLMMTFDLLSLYSS